MTELIDRSAPVALDRLAAWQLAPRAENKSPGTVAVYADGAARYLRWCSEHDRLPMSRAALNQWVADLLDAGATGTARIRQQAVRRFAAWLTAGGELPVDPFPGMKAPRVEPPLVEPLTDAELRALIKTCAVSDTAAVSVETTLHHRRDEAIIRLMFETAIRSGELVDLRLDDIDLIERLLTIRCGKGGRGRVILIGQATPRRCWCTSTNANSIPSPLPLTCGWVPAASGSVARASPAPYAAELSAPESRLSATPAPAHRRSPLARSGRLGVGLMAIAGWTRTDMLIRYTRAHATERAAVEARRLNLGDL